MSTLFRALGICPAGIPRDDREGGDNTLSLCPAPSHGFPLLGSQADATAAFSLGFVLTMRI
jgi:hypothetical protein